MIGPRRHRAKTPAHVPSSALVGGKETPHRHAASDAGPTSRTPVGVPAAKRARGSCRHGVTLMEILLVLAVLVIITSLAWPALDRTFDTQRLRKAADQVAATWGRARIQAMSTGRIHIFQHVVGGDRYAVHKRAGSELDVGATTDPTPLGFANASLETPTPAGPGRRLPDGITFAASEAAYDSRAQMAAADPTQFRSTEQGWSNPIFFYPDGTTSTAQLAVRNQRGCIVVLTLRGLTGIVTVGDVQTPQEEMP